MRTIFLLLASTAILSCATTPDASGPGTFPERWIDGTRPDEPAIQVHAYDPDTLILRQSLRTNFEAPFLYLLFGDERALLLDTGAGGIPLGETVDAILADRVARGRPDVELVVAHLHPHGDHVAGDAEFATRPRTRVVGHAREDVAAFFGIERWPEQIVQFDLGGRALDVIPIPGHHPAHIAVYDPRCALLLTGDSLYPGRLYVPGARSRGAMREYAASVRRLVDFCRDRPLRWILGTHIEMTRTPGADFPMGAVVHPDERELQLERRHLLELDAVVSAMVDAPRIERRDDFIVYPIR